MYDGTSDTSLAINNDLDLTKGGLVWTKERSSTGGGGNILFSTDASGNHSGLLFSNTTASAGSGYQPDYFTFRNNGYTTTNTVGDTKVDGREYVSWSFRNQPKFFDIVQYTGNGTAGKTVAHNLGSVPGMIMVKVTSTSDSWALYHRGSNGGTNPEDYMLRLNTTDAQANNADYWNDTAPTDSVFTVGTDPGVNGNGVSYIAYIFAHNNDDGGFGEPGDQDIIKCGSYTGNGSSTGPVIDLGFEPGFIMLKRTDDTQNAHWYAFDSLRGISTGGDDPYLYWNNTNAEVAGNAIEVTPTGFQLKDTGTGFNGSNATYVYMAIRRGGMQTPTAASDVFEAVAYTGNGATRRAIGSISRADLVLVDDRNNDSSISGRGVCVFDRLRGENALLMTQSTDGDSNGWENDYFNLDQSGGWRSGDSDADFFNKSSSTYISWTWARARGYFDMVAYSGTGSARTISHNLGVAPEMMWVKRRDATGFWSVYHKGVNGGSSPEDYYLVLHDNNAATDDATIFNDTAPTSSVFSVGTHNRVNNSSGTYIAYLFATVAGISKVGSFQGDGGDVTVDCGFTNGCKFILFKDTGSGAHWRVFDSVRGINSGADPMTSLNLTSAEITTSDLVDPTSSGFTAISTSANVYIFYAIANDPS